MQISITEQKNRVKQDQKYGRIRHNARHETGQTMSRRDKICLYSIGQDRKSLVLRGSDQNRTEQLRNPPDQGRIEHARIGQVGPSRTGQDRKGPHRTGWTLQIRAG